MGHNQSDMPTLALDRRNGAANSTFHPDQAPRVATTCAAHPPSRAVAPLSATILTRNSARLLGPVLAALDWCDEIVVLDTGSTDETPAIATRYPNVSYHYLSGPFPGFGPAHRHAAALARHDWILSIDSDEVVSPELAREIRALHLDAQTVYTIPFRNHFNGRRITTCGWHPEFHERLFHRRVTDFSAGLVHEKVRTAGLRLVKLRHPIDHYSYTSLTDFLRKMNAYACLFAEQNAGRKTAGPVKAVARSLWAFFRTYVLKLGCTQGSEGLVISAYNAQTVFWKYLLLAEANRRLKS
jgi:glycosyltransferase involved in cell wall biosynthesis